MLSEAKHLDVDTRSFASLRMIASLGAVFLTLAVMLALTWRTWPDPITDFGRELYVPWQLSQGKMLYRDIAYFNGPLSPHFNSTLFSIFGPGLMTLAWANIVILVGVLLMLHRLVVRMADLLTATVACCTTIVLVAVGQSGAMGNYNFVTPYSHEMTHGIALSLGAIVCVDRFLAGRKRVWIVVAGVLLGLIFLTKPEIFVAAFVAMAAGLLFARRGSKCNGREIGLFFGSAMMIVAVALGMLSAALSIREAASGVLGGWRFVFDRQITGLPFYQRVRGTYDLHQTIRMLTLMSLGYAIVFGLPALIGRFVPRHGANRNWIFTVSVAIFAALLIGRDAINWQEAGMPLIFVAFACASHAGTSAMKDADRSAILRLVFSLFALALLAKLPLHVVFYHYGFALAAPALVLAIVVVIGWMPAWIDARGGCGAIARVASLAVIVVTAGMYLNFEMRTVSAKTTLVGTDRDAFFTSVRGQIVNDALAQVDLLPPGATLAVVPEGAMVNYLARRPNSTPFAVLMPPEVLMFGPERIAQTFREHPPDFVLMVRCDFQEYGYDSFAQYAADVSAQLDQDYRDVAGVSDPGAPWTVLKHR